MAIVRLKNGIIASTPPMLILIDIPEGTTYKGVEATKLLKNFEMWYDVHPREVDDLTKWKQGDDDGFEIVDILSKEEAEKHLKQ